MKTILLLAACTAALMGCAGNETAVRATALRDFGTGQRTFALANDSARTSDIEANDFASAIERRLAELGFAAAPIDAARYRLAVSHETRPASVGVRYSRCADGAPCGAAILPPGFEWPGQKAYIHSLTLRFFDRADGSEVYKVSATKRDGAPDARRDIDDLVASALARLPFAQTETGAGDPGRKTDWKVTLSKPGADAGAGARVTRIVPLAQ